MFGILGLLNLEVTAISSNFVSLMFILSISMNIHIINYYKQNYNKNDNYIFETLKKMFWPCLYTVLTTMVAFTSLIISDIKPIIDFGIIMILSLLVIIISSFTILPLFISFYPNLKNSISINFSILNTFFNLSVKFYKQIILFNIIVLIISIFGISKLNVENSFINYFKKNTDIYKGMKLIDAELGGTTPLDILITFKNENNENFNEINMYDDEILEDDELLSDDLFSQIDSNSTWFTLEKLTILKIS
jgi:Predicted exporters of the RND superfamily